MKQTYTLLAASFLGMAAANAATISWSSGLYTVNGNVGQNLDTGIFDTSGTEILAENVNGGALIFDGINFTAGAIDFGSNYAGYHEASSDLSKTGTYNAALSTVSLSSLELGKSYRVQALIYDGRGGQNGRTVEFDGSDQGQFGYGVGGVTWGDGLLVTGTFVADATTQDFTIEAFNVGGATAGGQLNAILVHEVPEPSSAALLGLGGLALILRRRKG